MKNPAFALVVVAVVVLTALLWWFKPAAEQAAGQAPVAERTVAPVAPVAPVEPTVAVEPAPLRAEWRIEGGKLASGPAIVRAQQGQALQLSFVSDHADEVHLHGYDLPLKLTAGVPATLEFKAEHSGRFELELHHAHLEVAVIEVLPR